MYILTGNKEYRLNITTAFETRDLVTGTVDLKSVEEVRTLYENGRIVNGSVFRIDRSANPPNQSKGYKAPPKMVTEKAKKMLNTLIYATRRQAESDNSTNWTWANHPIDGETRNNIYDMLRLLGSYRRQIPTDLSLKVIDLKTALYKHSIYDIVESHLKDRDKVMKEVYN